MYMTNLKGALDRFHCFRTIFQDSEATVPARTSPLFLSCPFILCTKRPMFISYRVQTYINAVKEIRCRSNQFEAITQIKLWATRRTPQSEECSWYQQVFCFVYVATIQTN